MAKAKAKRGPARKRKEWRPDSSVCEPGPVSDACVEADAYEPSGDASPAVVTRGDLNRLAVDYLLPVANEMVLEGQLRERMQEVDGKRPESRTYWLVEVAHNVFETTSRLPHGMPPMRFTGKPSEAYWRFVQHLEQYRVARGELARKIARESTFLVAGKGVQT